MTRKNYLDCVQIKTLGYFYFNSPINDSYKGYSNKLHLTPYFSKKIITELQEKNWIKVKRKGNKVMISIAKRPMPKYIEQSIEQYISQDPSFFSANGV